MKKQRLLTISLLFLCSLSFGSLAYLHLSPSKADSALSEELMQVNSAHLGQRSTAHLINHAASTLQHLLAK